MKQAEHTPSPGDHRMTSRRLPRHSRSAQLAVGLTAGLGAASRAARHGARASGWSLLLAAALLLGASPLRAEPTSEILVEGAQRIEPETVRSYLSLEPGRAVDAADLARSIKALYQTGFFREVSIEERDGRLVVKVVENPTIAEVDFRGNDDLSDDDLKGLVQLQANQIYDPAKADKDLAAVRQAYRVKGLFLARVEAGTEPLENNRLRLVYNIAEGQKSKVQQVRILGNRQMDAGDLKKGLLIEESGWLSWMDEKDTYDKEKLQYDQTRLRNTYMNNGFVHARVTSSVAELTPDRQAFIVTHTVEEGERYTLGGGDSHRGFCRDDPRRHPGGSGPGKRFLVFPGPGAPSHGTGLRTGG
ncbi:MAG: hypothetical protein H7831_12770 [Magnetococcus sp. WYHC-3]